MRASRGGDDEDNPLGEGEAGLGEQRLEQRAEGALGRADDLGAERRLIGHGALPGIRQLRWRDQR